MDRRNLLGATDSDILTFNHHITALVEKITRSLSALKTIRAHGLVGNALWDVSRHEPPWSHSMLYASPDWLGFLRVDDRTGFGL